MQNARTRKWSRRESAPTRQAVVTGIDSRTARRVARTFQNGTRMRNSRCVVLKLIAPRQLAVMAARRTSIMRTNSSADRVRRTFLTMDSKAAPCGRSPDSRALRAYSQHLLSLCILTGQPPQPQHVVAQPVGRGIAAPLAHAVHVAVPVGALRHVQHGPGLDLGEPLAAVALDDAPVGQRDVRSDERADVHPHDRLRHTGRPAGSGSVVFTASGTVRGGISHALLRSLPMRVVITS